MLSSITPLTIIVPFAFPLVTSKSSLKIPCAFAPVDELFVTVKTVSFKKQNLGDTLCLDNSKLYTYSDFVYENVISQKEQNILVEIEKQKAFKYITSLSDSPNKTLLMKEMFHDYLKIYLSKKHNIEPDELIQLIELRL